MYICTYPSSHNYHMHDINREVLLEQMEHCQLQEMTSTRWLVLIEQRLHLQGLYTYMYTYVHVCICIVCMYVHTPTATLTVHER